MTNQLLEAATPGIGHNKPPLAEQLKEEFAPFITRHRELVDTAKTALIIDRESAEKVVDLDKLIKTLESDLSQVHDQLKRPFIEACREIDRAYAVLADPLRLVRQGENGRGGLRGMLTTWQRQEEEKARAERQRLEAEKRVREAEAEAIRRAAEISGSIADELAATQAEAMTRRLAEQAAATRPDPLRSNLGAVSTRRQITFTITNLRLLLGWMLKQPGIKAQIEQAARTITGKYLHVVGVDTVERGVEIPGVEASIERVATVL